MTLLFLRCLLLLLLLWNRVISGGLLELALDVRVRSLIKNLSVSLGVLDKGMDSVLYLMGIDARLLVSILSLVDMLFISS